MKKILFLCYAGLITSSSAIVVQNYAVAEEAPSEATPPDKTPPDTTRYDLMNWDHVYSYNGSTAVAVTNDWIVTAGHVGQAASFFVDGVPLRRWSTRTIRRLIWP